MSLNKSASKSAQIRLFPSRNQYAGTVCKYDRINLNDNSGQRSRMRRSAIQGDQSSPRKRNTAACVTALHGGQLQANYAVQIQAYCVTAVALDREGDVKFGYLSRIPIRKLMESWRAHSSCCGHLRDCGRGRRVRREAGCRGAWCRGNISYAHHASNKAPIHRIAGSVGFPTAWLTSLKALRLPGARPRCSPLIRHLQRLEASFPDSQSDTNQAPTLDAQRPAARACNEFGFLLYLKGGPIAQLVRAADS